MTAKSLFSRARLVSLPLVALLLVALPFAAAAQNARAARWVNLRAGPAQDYPLVARYAPNAPLAVQGCTDGFAWCDVVGPDNARGWIYGGNISYPYQQAYVPIISFGPQIGVPVVTFAIGSYWGSYYRDRPWYGRYPRYENHRPPPRPIVRPPVRPPGWNRPPPNVRPPGDHRPPGGRPPGVRAPGDHRPPGARPPGDHRPGAGTARPGGGGRPGGAGAQRPERSDGPRPQPR